MRVTTPTYTRLCLQVDRAWCHGTRNVFVVLAPKKLDAAVEELLFMDVMVPAFKQATEEEVEARREALRLSADMQDGSDTDEDAEVGSGSDSEADGGFAAARALSFNGDDAAEEAAAVAQPAVVDEECAPRQVDLDVIVPRTLYTWDSALSTCELFQRLIERLGPGLGLDLMIDLLKYAAAATQMQQPADRSRVFPVVHRHTKTHQFSARKRDVKALLADVSDSSESALLVRKMDKVFAGKVKEERKNMILQFFAQVPDLLDSALRGDFVRGGWEAAGISMKPDAEELLSKWTSWSLQTDERKAQLVKGCHELVEVLIEKGKLGEEDYRAKLITNVRPVDNKPLSWRYCEWVNNEVRVAGLRAAQQAQKALLEQKMGQQHERANAKVGERKCRTCARSTTDGKERVVNRWEERGAHAHEWVGCDWCDWYVCGECRPSVRLRCDGCKAHFDLKFVCPTCQTTPRSLLVNLHQGLTHEMSREVPKAKAPAKPRKRKEMAPAVPSAPMAKQRKRSA